MTTTGNPLKEPARLFKQTEQTNRATSLPNMFALSFSKRPFARFTFNTPPLSMSERKLMGFSGGGAHLGNTTL